MPIVTDFEFQHMHPGGEVHAKDVVDFLGPLRAFVGGALGSAQRNWAGTGFNMIWRPNRPGETGPQDFFLELNLTTETLDFKEISGATGVANRGFFQQAAFLGAVAYVQAINDSFDGSGQHFEPGVWGNAPATTDPAEPTSVFRMGSIPHGTTINLQGRGFVVNGPPQFAVSRIIPFTEGATDDGSAEVRFFDQFTDLTQDNASRTPNANVAALTQPRLLNPNLFLSDAIVGQTITRTTVLQIASNTALVSGGPDVGGGTDNIAFLAGKPVDTGAANGGGRPNANAPIVTATFWVEEGNKADGSPLLQLQYTQRVLLNFNNLSWPHVTVATMVPQ